VVREVRGLYDLALALLLQLKLKQHARREIQ
jgi:hypothetical protein